MLEEANYIFNYLPTRFKSILEDEYQKYLWSSFQALCERDKTQAPSFSIVPFHMLVLLSIHYKILRIAKAKPEHYPLAYTFNNIVRGDQERLKNPTSPFDVSKLAERSTFDILQFVNADSALIQQAKQLVDRRNELAHVTGAIELDAGSKIDTYLELLQALQAYFTDINDIIANDWLAEIAPEDDKDTFVDTRLAESYLCPADFRDGLLLEHFPRDSE